VRRLLIVLAIPLLLLVGADLGLRLVAQYLLGRELATSLNLSERPKVSLHGFPFLLHLAKGSFPTASATGSALRTQGLTFQSFQLTLNDVAFTPGKLVSGSAATIRAASGRGIATVTGKQATAALKDQGNDVTVVFVGGRVRLRSPLIPVEVAGDLTLAGSGTRLDFHPSDARLPVTVSVPLPAFVEGARFTNVGVVGSTAVLSFTLDHPSIQIGG